MPQDGKFADRDHWLRNIVGDIPDPCSVAAAQNHCFHMLNTNLVETDHRKANANSTYFAVMSPWVSGEISR